MSPADLRACFSLKKLTHLLFPLNMHHTVNPQCGYAGQYTNTYHVLDFALFSPCQLVDPAKSCTLKDQWVTVMTIQRSAECIRKN